MIVVPELKRIDVAQHRSNNQLSRKTLSRLPDIPLRDTVPPRLWRAGASTTFISLRSAAVEIVVAGAQQANSR
jgi:hypothetical protein